MEILQIILLSALGIWFLFYLTWVYYIAFMTIKKNIGHVKENMFDFYSLMPHFIFGYFIDILLQMTYGILAFRELPKEWTLSGRVIRHQENSKGWRLLKANSLCNRYLRPFDPTHCL